MNPLHETLHRLVEISSVTGNEGRICTAIAERMLPTWQLDGVVRVGNSLVVGARTGRPLVTLYGHTDTVPEQGNGAVRIEGGTMYGLGTSDMKAGLAVMIHLLEDEEVRDGPFDLIGVFYDKEEGPADENGLDDVLNRTSWLSSADLAIVMEPTANKLELGCNGVINADVVFHGAASHSARPWMGENAVTKAGAWLAELHARQPAPVTIHGLEYREVFSVTTAQGGVATNILPARFVVNLNHRFPPVYSLDDAESRLREVAAAGDEIIIKDRAPAGGVPEGNPLLDALEAALATELAAKQGWTDVARLSARGIPAVNYGPGIPEVAHHAGEYVPLSNLEESFAKLKGFLTAG